MADIGPGWARHHEDALDKMAAVRTYLDQCLAGVREPTPGDLARASGLLLYASGSLFDASGLGSPPPDPAGQLDDVPSPNREESM